MCRKPESESMVDASFQLAVGGRVTGSAVIQSATRASAPAAQAVARNRSRSVRMPTHFSPSETTTEPTWWSCMRAAASPSVSSMEAVSTGDDINSRTTAPSAIQPPWFARPGETLPGFAAALLRHMARGRRGRWLLLAVAALAATACQSPLTPKRSGHIDAVTIAASLSADGILSVTEDVRFDSSDGGGLTLKAPAPAHISNLT